MDSQNMGTAVPDNHDDGLATWLAAVLLDPPDPARRLSALLAVGGRP